MAKWTIDPAHSVAAFSVRHMTVANVRGQFNNIAGTIEMDEAAPERSSVTAEIEVASITTGIRKRDDHLLSADFFDAAKYPKITFKSTKIEPAGSNGARISGDLTIHGITRPVIMEAEYFGPVKSPEDLGGETTIGFSAYLTIDRQDFDVKWNVPIEAGLMVGNDVKINLDIEADLAE
ncbi:MAG: YceI family protein [Candidatus Sulfobium sp.]|jgi:polyisoprenoid-binding protein YceI